MEDEYFCVLSAVKVFCDTLFIISSNIIFCHINLAKFVLNYIKFNFSGCFIPWNLRIIFTYLDGTNINCLMAVLFSRALTGKYPVSTIYFIIILIANL